MWHIGFRFDESDLAGLLMNNMPRCFGFSRQSFLLCAWFYSNLISCKELLLYKVSSFDFSSSNNPCQRTIITLQ